MWLGCPHLIPVPLTGSPSQEAGSQKRPPKRVVPNTPQDGPSSHSRGCTLLSGRQGTGWGVGEASWNPRVLAGGSEAGSGKAGPRDDLPLRPSLRCGRPGSRTCGRGAGSSSRRKFWAPGADIRAGVGAGVACPRPGRGVRVGAKRWAGSVLPAGPAGGAPGAGRAPPSFPRRRQGCVSMGSGDPPTPAAASALAGAPGQRSSGLQWARGGCEGGAASSPPRGPRRLRTHPHPQSPWSSGGRSGRAGLPAGAAGDEGAQWVGGRIRDAFVPSCVPSRSIF